MPGKELFNDRSAEYLDGYNPFLVELSSTPYHREGRREHERREAGDERIGPTDPRIVYTCGQVFVNGEPYREVPLREELTAGSWWFERDGERLHIDFGDLPPGDQSVEISTRRRIFAPKHRGLGHIVVEGFVFEHCGNQYPTNFWKNDAYAQRGAVGAEAGHNWVIRRNVIRHAKTFAIDIGRVDRHNQPADAHDNLIEQNYIIDNGSAGILSNGSRNLVIRGNVILRNNRLRFDGVKRWEQAGVKCHYFDSGLIEGNYIADNTDTYGVWLDNQFPDSRVSRNVIVNNGSAGVFLEMSDYGFDRLLVDNNVIVGNAKNAVYIHDASGATFAHNLLAGTVATPGRGQAVYIRQVTARTKTYHHSFFNNLLIDNPLGVDVNYPAARSGPQRFDCNVYSLAPSERKFWINQDSDTPSPWSEEAFAELIGSELSLGPALKSPPVEDGAARLTLDEWRRFWGGHDLKNDANSVVAPHASVRYLPESHVLEVQVDIDPTAVGSIGRPEVAADFLGKPVKDSGDAVPGPFQDLRRGMNRFEVWSGLPVLAKGELPPTDWNR